MTVSCIIFIGHESMDSEQVVELVAVPSVGDLIMLPGDVVRKVTTIRHIAAKGGSDPSVRIVVSEG
jgi:hypothetical protein